MFSGKPSDKVHSMAITISTGPSAAQQTDIKAIAYDRMHTLHTQFTMLSQLQAASISRRNASRVAVYRYL